ncbi:MAG: YkgJ family cysteine cluster protein [Thermoplasmatota archaeon]
MTDIKTQKRADEDAIIEREWTPLRKGTRWECLKCAWCCRQPWAVNMTWYEHDRMRDDDRFSDLLVDRIEVDEQTGLTHPFFRIDGRCALLDEETSLCRVYPDWFYTCATYPFLLLPDGRIMVHRQCRGFGHGPVVKRSEIEGKIIRERARAGMTDRHTK